MLFLDLAWSIEIVPFADEPRAGTEIAQLLVKAGHNLPSTPACLRVTFAKSAQFRSRTLVRIAEGVKSIGLQECQKRLRTSQMLNAAGALFSGQGYDATGIKEIAQRADIAPATVYNHFDTKPNLLMALALRHVHVAMPERRAFLKSLPEDPVDGIRAFERLLAKQALRHLSKGCWRVILCAARGGSRVRRGAFGTSRTIARRGPPRRSL